MALEINKNYLQNQQYKTSSNLEARIAIHKFTTSGESFHSWVWNKLKLVEPVDILDVGCGTGKFWVENYSKLPEGSTLVMTDFSEGMIEKAKQNLSYDGIKFEVADIENLTYQDNSFNIVMANHVVYHSQDKNKALSELKRVCVVDGKVAITTNSEQHMLKVYDIGVSLDKNFPVDRIIDTFTEEVADKMLNQYFKKIDKFVSADILKVPDADVVVNYIRTVVEPRKINVQNDFFDKYREIVLEEIEKEGFFTIQKRSPVYICSN